MVTAEREEVEALEARLVAVEELERLRLAREVAEQERREADEVNISHARLYYYRKISVMHGYIIIGKSQSCMVIL